MSFPGWTWEYIDDCMDLPRLSVIYKKWKRTPPVHIMIAAYLGYLKKEPQFVDQSAMPLDGLFESMSNATS